MENRSGFLGRTYKDPFAKWKTKESTAQFRRDIADPAAVRARQYGSQKDFKKG